MELLAAIVVLLLWPDGAFPLNIVRNDVEPIKYDVYIEPHFSGDEKTKYGTVTGESIITVIFTRDGVKKLRLDAEGLYCSKLIVISTEINATIACTCSDTSDSIDILCPGGLKPESVYVFNVFYVGRMGLDRGLRWDTFMVKRSEKRHVIWSEMGALNARKLFPCILDPQFRTPIDLIISTPQEYETHSNEGIDHKFASENKYLMHFTTTPLIPSYMLSIVFMKPMPTFSSTFELRLVKDGRPKTTYSAVDAMLHALLFYEHEFELSYENLGIHKFFGMGHYKLHRNAVIQSWGVGLYDEELLKFDWRTDTVREHQLLLTKLTTAIAVNWFANAVSPRTWADSWISQGLTKYYEYFGANRMYPYLRTDIQFVVDEMHPMMLLENFNMQLSFYDETFATKDYTENIINSWLHTKAAAVLRMISHAISEKRFRNLMGFFIRTRLERTYTKDHLHYILGLHAPANTKAKAQIMFLDWTSAVSIPTINVSLAEDGMSANFRRLDRERIKLAVTAHYPTIPLTYVTSEDPHTNDTFPKEYMMTGEWMVTLNFTEPVEWIIVNNQRTGLYRSLYTTHAYDVLGEALLTNHTQIHQLNRAQLIEDLFFFHISHFVSADTLFKFLRYLPKEVDYAPWKAVMDGLIRLSVHFDQNDLPYLEEYVWYVSKNIHKKLGFYPKQRESVLDSHLRNLILNTNCRFRHANISIEAMSMLFDEVFEVKHRSIPSDILTTVTCCAVRQMDARLYRNVIETYNKMDLVKERRRFFDGMACTTHPLNIETYVNMMLKNIPVPERETIITRIVQENPTNAWFLYLLITKDYQKLLNMFQNIKSVRQVLRFLSIPLSHNEFQHWEFFTDRYNATLHKNDSTVTNGHYVRHYYNLWKTAEYKKLVEYLKNKTYLPAPPPPAVVSESNKHTSYYYAREVLVLGFIFFYLSRRLY